jgi:hypothetical protein
MPTTHQPPLAIRRTLRKLGLDIRDARRRRGPTAEIVAEHAFTSQPTLRRIEAGDRTVGIGIYASVIHALGLLDGLGMIADPAQDADGLAIASENLPKRLRARRPKGAANGG